MHSRVADQIRRAYQELELIKPLGKKYWHDKKKPESYCSICGNSFLRSFSDKHFYASHRLEYKELREVVHRYIVGKINHPEAVAQVEKIMLSRNYV